MWSVPRERPSYAWALHPQASNRTVEGLSETARQGLADARELAAAARARSHQNLRNARKAKALTLTGLATRHGRSPATVRRWIMEARRELFGDLSEAAIYKRLQRQRHLHPKPLKRCQQPGCNGHLAANVHGHQKYCRRHASPAERTRRHRQRKSAHA